MVLIEVDATNRDPQVMEEMRKYGKEFLPANFLLPPGNSEVVILPEFIDPQVAVEALDDAVN